MSLGGITRRRFLALGAGTAAVVGLGSCAAGRGSLATPVIRETVSYGPDALQRGELRTFAATAPQPLVVLIHGGYWRTGWSLSAMEPLAEDLARRGYASWNINYRSVGDPGGGWPGTLQDVASALDRLAELAKDRPLDLERVAVIGHSAGAQLAFWTAIRSRLSAGQPGAEPTVKPAALVSLSGVLDLAAASIYRDADAGELSRATAEFLGGSPDQVPERYRTASPIAQLPLDAAQLLLHGSADSKVPPEQARNYHTAAERAGDPVRMVELPGVDHFDTIRREKVWWEEVIRWLPDQIGRGV
ncbi:MAG: alpha/beta hydrolase [Acidimicrobiales bacterium]|nr:alpha/beta hydrolase [Acidimicrobiales bacterium]